MSDELKRAVLRYARTTDPPAETIPTPVRGLWLVRRTAPGAVLHTVVKPLVCVVLQGCKRVATGSGVSTCAAGESMLVTGDMVALTRITQASIAQPYVALALDLDAALITELALIAPEPPRPRAAVDTADELRDALRRLVCLLDRPESLGVLKDGLIREIHHWLLLGRDGRALRGSGLPDGHARRIARAVALLRADPAQPLHIGRLAAAADMSRSAFHQHFRAITTLTPLQFQKQLRLVEARRLIWSRGNNLSQVAFEVGYESASQFSREYARMYGRPPRKDKQAASLRRGQVGIEV